MSGTYDPTDERDAAMLAERIVALDKIPGFRVGDYVEFANGVTRRISHIWDDGPQTSDSGSYFLGKGLRRVLRRAVPAGDDLRNLSWDGVVGESREGYAVVRITG